MKGQFFIFAAIIVVTTVAWTLQAYTYAQGYSRIKASDTSAIAQNLATEFAYASAIIPSNISGRMADFISFAKEYAAGRNFELNVTNATGKE